MRRRKEVILDSLPPLLHFKPPVKTEYAPGCKGKRLYAGNNGVGMVAGVNRIQNITAEAFAGLIYTVLEPLPSLSFQP
jgi:hypothetical protein